MIKILIADDSPTERAALKALFESQPDLQVVGCANNGKEAVEMTANLHPDVVTMDIQMPLMDGLEATRAIMAKTPTPIVVISTLDNINEEQATFNALAAGALTVLGKIKNFGAASSDYARTSMVQTVRSMSEIKVITRRVLAHKTKPAFTPAAEVHSAPAANPYGHQYEILAMGASVGGPQVLKKVLSDLPADFSMPIVIVQHMTQGFIGGFIHWLDEQMVLKVKEAMPGELLVPGSVYFAPDAKHLEVVRREGKLAAHLVVSEPVAGFCPSITVLMNSVALTCRDKALGALMTGMGYDGSYGLLEMKKAGGHTMIQDPKSTVVFGMAGVAQTLGAADKVVELDLFADYLKQIAGKNTIKV